LNELAYDISSEQLPARPEGARAGGTIAISIVIAGPDANEAAGQSSSLSNGIAFATRIAKQIAESPVMPRKLWSSSPISRAEDSTITNPSPPPPHDIDPADVPYGPRVPFLALGAGVHPNHVSHAQLEHSSLTRFIEWNWFDGQTGQLGFRDRIVNNLGAYSIPRRSAPRFRSPTERTT
jgi:hypothetical protein